jgi:hypothetical protein
MINAVLTIYCREKYLNDTWNFGGASLTWALGMHRLAFNKIALAPVTSTTYRVNLIKQLVLQGKMWETGANGHHPQHQPPGRLLSGDHYPEVLLWTPIVTLLDADARFASMEHSRVGNLVIGVKHAKLFFVWQHTWNYHRYEDCQQAHWHLTAAVGNEN